MSNVWAPRIIWTVCTFGRLVEDHNDFWEVIQCDLYSVGLDLEFA
jgi:hypothetical protein